MRLIRFLFVAFMGLMTVFSAFSQIDNISDTVINNQWDKPLSIEKTTTLVLLSTDKKTGTIVKDALNEMKISDLGALQWVYVADISGMPSIITKMFALPKMKKYAFPMALDKTGEATKEWPRKDSKVSAIVLNALSITEVYYFDDAANLVEFLKTR